MASLLSSTARSSGAAAAAAGALFGLTTRRTLISSASSSYGSTSRSWLSTPSSSSSSASPVRNFATSSRALEDARLNKSTPAPAPTSQSQSQPQSSGATDAIKGIQERLGAEKDRLTNQQQQQQQGSKSSSVLDTFLSTLSGARANQSKASSHLRYSHLSEAERAEVDFSKRGIAGEPIPRSPTTYGRTVRVVRNDVASAYRGLSSILRRNDLRRELRLGDRYEKPNEERRRKRSERHRRRFRDMIRKKVQLVMAIRARGA